MPWRALLAVAAFVVLVAAGFSTWLARVSPTGSTFDRSAYLARLQTIVSADRLPYAIAGLEIASLHPVLGAGHESFAYRYAIYFDRPGGPFHRSGVRVPDPATAHSVYFQTWSGTGTVGLVLLLAILLTAAVTVFRVRRAPEVSRRQRAVVAAAVGSLLGMACYGLFQEIFYVHALRVMFFVAVGLIAGLATDLVRWPPRVAPVLWTMMAAAFAGHLVYEYLTPGPDRLLRSGEPTGLYAEDAQPAFKGHALERRPGHVAGAGRRFAIRPARAVLRPVSTRGRDPVVRRRPHHHAPHQPRLARPRGGAPGVRCRRPSAHAGDADMVGPGRCAIARRRDRGVRLD